MGFHRSAAGPGSTVGDSAAQFATNLFSTAYLPS